MLEKCSNQHVEIHWDMLSSIIMRCPICTLREEAVSEEEEHDRELEGKDEEIRELGWTIESQDEEIEDKEADIKSLKEKVNELEIRIRQSVLGEVDRLKEKIGALKDANRATIAAKEAIIESKESTITEKEADIMHLENKVVPPHIPFEQYQKYIDEKNRR